MSIHLVKRWRRIAREWTQACVRLELAGSTEAVERADCRARADVLEDCADSLERSLNIARRKRNEKP